jgi:hypothetical protein
VNKLNTVKTAVTTGLARVTQSHDACPTPHLPVAVMSSLDLINPVEVDRAIHHLQPHTSPLDAVPVSGFSMDNADLVDHAAAEKNGSRYFGSKKLLSDYKLVHDFENFGTVGIKSNEAVHRGIAQFWPVAVHLSAGSSTETVLIKMMDLEQSLCSLRDGHRVASTSQKERRYLAIR